MRLKCLHHATEITCSLREVGHMYAISFLLSEFKRTDSTHTNVNLIEGVH